MKKKLASIALSTVMTGSMLLSPMVYAEQTNIDKITIQEDAQIYTQNQDKLEKNIIKFNKKNELGFLKGKLSSKLEKDMDGVIKFFEENKDIFKINNPKEEFELISKKTDNLGYTHIKLQQMYRGTPLYGRQYIVHFDDNGNIYVVNGLIDNEVYKKFPKKADRSANIGRKSAIEIAKNEVKAKKIMGEPEVKYCFYELNNEYIPVYEVSLGVLEPEMADWHIFIHAKTGEVVNKNNRLATVLVKGVGKGVLGDEKEINLDYRNGKYYMIDDSRNGVKIKTYDASDVPEIDFISKYFLPGDIMYDKDDVLDEEIYKSAVDAHKYAGYVYDYYKNNFGRNSIDDKGMDIISSVHYGNNLSNAFWNGEQMVYGDGDGKTSAPLTGALDIVGHEMTHGVTAYEAGLEYQGQSGALNESFSDVFGTLIEFEYQPEKADYLCGEDVWTPNIKGDALRDLQDPGSDKAYSKQPSYMKDYVNTTDDHGGVHINSGIPNKAAYLVINSIGPKKTGQIYYRALTTYLTNKSNFYDARLALLQSAEDIYGKDSKEYRAVENAFDSVGIK